MCTTYPWEPVWTCQKVSHRKDAFHASPNSIPRLRFIIGRARDVCTWPRKPPSRFTRISFNIIQLIRITWNYLWRGVCTQVTDDHCGTSYYYYCTPRSRSGSLAFQSFPWYHVHQYFSAVRRLRAFFHLYIATLLTGRDGRVRSRKDRHRALLFAPGKWFFFFFNQCIQCSP